MRIVLDTNIYIAAALQNGFSSHVVEILAKTSEFEILISEEILTELEQKLKNKFNWPQANVDLFLNRIKKLAELVVITKNVSVITRDPQDDKIIDCAVNGKTDLIVSLDQDLIKLKNFCGIAIVHPKTLSWTFPNYFKKKNN